MTVFWKPIPTVLRDEYTNVKVLGSGLYALWARCDLCYNDGPSSEFVLAQRYGDTIAVCSECGGDEHLWVTLRADGWSAS